MKVVAEDDVKRVSDYMSKGVVSIGVGDTVLDAVKVLRDNNVAGAPVLDDEGNLVGVFSESDVLKLIESHPFITPFLELLEDNPDDVRDAMRIASEKTVGEVMSKHPVTVRQDDSLSEAAALMWGKNINRLPVVDDNGSLVGIIARADLLKAFVD